MDSFEKLKSLRETSRREFCNIQDNIDKGINDLILEVHGLDAQLAITTKERNDLIQTVNDLKQEIKLLKAKLTKIKILPNIEDNRNQDTAEEDSLQMEVSAGRKQDVERSQMSSKGDEDGEEHVKYASNDRSQLDVSAFNDLSTLDTTFSMKEESLEMEITDTDQQDVARFKMSSNGDQEEHVSNYVTIKHTNDPLLEEDPLENELMNDDISILTGRDKKFKCKLCQYTSNVSLHIKKHIEAAHKNTNNHVCGECGYVASRKTNLKRHIEGAHENIKHVCEKCGYAASHMGDLKKHNEAEHEKIKNHVCRECGYTALQKDALREHIEAVHENTKSHVCRDCGYSATRKTHLKRHITAVHENNRSHVCGECGYATSLKQHLKKHIEAVHEKIRKHVCGECGYAASQTAHLKYHQESAHNIGDKKITCRFCPYKAYRKVQLIQHVEKVHEM